MTWERTRFDFSHPKAVTAEEIAKIEQLVNHVILHNKPLAIAHMGYDDAIKFGAMALFGEKYGDGVRVVKMGDFSAETVRRYTRSAHRRHWFLQDHRRRWRSSRYPPH